MPTLTRRDALLLAASAGSASGLLLANDSAAATPAAAARLGLDDPRRRSMLMAKLRGSTAEETVYTFCRLHLFLWLNEGNLVPMLTMQNLNATTWRPLPNGNYAGVMHEVGAYTKFDSDELVDSWKNPVTGEEREIWHFSSGPMNLEMGPDGLQTALATALKPKEMRIDILGDLLLAPNYSARSFPNPISSAKYPRDGGDSKFYWDSHYLFTARIGDLLNPRIHNAPATVQYQNMVSFHPWLGMGTRPGRTYGKGVGTKLRNLGELPAGPRAALEKRAPEIFDLPNWKTPTNDFEDYVNKRKPT